MDKPIVPAELPDLVIVNHRIDFDNGRRARLLVEQGLYTVTGEFTGFTILEKKAPAPTPGI